MDKRLKTAQKVLNDKFKGLIKEDKKLDKDRESCHAKVKEMTKKKKT